MGDQWNVNGGSTGCQRKLMESQWEVGSMVGQWWVNGGSMEVNGGHWMEYAGINGESIKGSMKSTPKRLPNLQLRPPQPPPWTPKDPQHGSKRHLPRFQILLPRPGGMGRSFFEYIYIYLLIMETSWLKQAPMLLKFVLTN